jgi:hypothetical protein
MIFHEEDLSEYGGQVQEDKDLPGKKLIPPIGDPCSLPEKSGALDAQLRLAMFWEPPGADPHAGWCGDTGGEIPPVIRMTSPCPFTVRHEKLSRTGSTASASRLFPASRRSIG